MPKKQRNSENDVPRKNGLPTTSNVNDERATNVELPIQSSTRSDIVTTNTAKPSF